VYTSLVVTLFHILNCEIQWQRQCVICYGTRRLLHIPVFRSIRPDWCLSDSSRKYDSTGPFSTKKRRLNPPATENFCFTALAAFANRRYRVSCLSASESCEAIVHIAQIQILKLLHDAANVDVGAAISAVALDMASCPSSHSDVHTLSALFNFLTWGADLSNQPR